MLKETSSVIFKHRVLAVLFAKAFFAVIPSPPRMIVLILLNEGTQDSSSIDVAAAVSSSSWGGKWLNSEGYIGFGKVQTV